MLFVATSLWAITITPANYLNNSAVCIDLEDDYEDFSGILIVELPLSVSDSVEYGEMRAIRVIAEGSSDLIEQLGCIGSNTYPIELSNYTDSRVFFVFSPEADLNLSQERAEIVVLAMNFNNDVNEFIIDHSCSGDNIDKPVALLVVKDGNISLAANSAQSDYAELSLFDIRGRFVSKVTNATGEISMNINEHRLSSGVYLYIINNTTGVKVASGKVVIVR